MPHALDSPTYKKLRRALTTARSRSGMTQTDLAVRLRRPQSFVSKYESGQRHLDVLEFIEVCKGLGVSPVAVLNEVLA
ncbi:helix-turn-helix domain-containing protein [Ramlibacter sp. Leaf400]|uniref:helix-turn-helix domain-containing protein n=1 Tax=Ramlibacter sp. Leaf400 TaxID=1736365 RepID=UPI0009E7D888|nr:helix-turn-helix transcriptional regulator [Ramlibacter sp. Leaf400]